jgi:hypothetical protein
MRRVIALPTLAYMLAACTPAPPAEDAGPDPFADFGEPIDAPPGEWSWVAFDDAACGNGAPAGIGVNPGSADAQGLLFYLEGGGLCWDDDSCNQQQFAYFVGSGFNSADFGIWADTFGGRGVWNRGDADNPFADWHLVYVPYCTGDVHIGNQPSTDYGVSHVGYANIGSFLHRVVPTFKDVEQVVLTGVSAGGYGAMMNFDRVRTAFSHVPDVNLLIDSAPPFTTTYFPQSFQDQLRGAWNAESVLPDDCPAEVCSDFHAAFVFALDKYPDARVGLVSSLEDTTIRFFIGVGQGNYNGIPATTYRAALGELLDTIFAVRDNASAFYAPGADHVFLDDDPLGSVNVYGNTLTDWVRKMNNGGRWGVVVPQ